MTVNRVFPIEQAFFPYGLGDVASSSRGFARCDQGGILQCYRYQRFLPDENPLLLPLEKGIKPITRQCSSSIRVFPIDPDPALSTRRWPLSGVVGLAAFSASPFPSPPRHRPESSIESRIIFRIFILFSPFLLIHQDLRTEHCNGDRQKHGFERRGPIPCDLV